MPAQKRCDWPEGRLEDVCEYITVGHVGSMADQYVPEGIPFLRSQNITPFKVDLTDVKYVSVEFHQKLKKSALRPGDVAIVRTGYPGTAAVIPATLLVSNCSDLVIIRPSPQLDPWFLSCAFNSVWGKGQVAGNLVGVAQQHFNVGAAKNLRIALPPVDTQRRISSILSAYDDLIENNTRRITVLEEMARRVYEEWFINFRSSVVFGTNGESLETWKPRNLYEIAEVTYGHPFKSKLFNGSGDGMPVIRIRDIKSNLTNTFTTEEGKPKHRIANGDILIGMDGGFHIGKWSGGNAWLNQRVVRLRPIPPMSRYLLCLAVEGPIKHLENTIVGTTVAHLSAQDLKKMEVLVPSDEVLRKAAEVFEPIFEQEIALKRKNTNLRAQRDLLLPKLISGEIDVSEAAESLEAAQ